VQWFRSGLVFEAHRLCVSLNSRLESNKEEEKGLDRYIDRYRYRWIDSNLDAVAGLPGSLEVLGGRGGCPCGRQEECLEHLARVHCESVRV